MISNYCAEHIFFSQFPLYNHTFNDINLPQNRLHLTYEDIEHFLAIITDQVIKSDAAIQNLIYPTRQARDKKSN